MADAPPPVPAAQPSPTPQTPNIPAPFNDAFSDLDKLVSPGDAGGEGDPAPPPADPPVPKPGEKPTPPAPPKPAESPKPSDEPKPGDKPPAKAAELRTAYEALKAKHKQLEAEHSALKSKPVDDPEKKTLAERLEKTDQRRKELEEAVKFAKYELSDDYKEKYHQPFIDAYTSGRAKTASLKAVDDEGNARQATAEDFDRIVGIADDDQASDLAAELFGNKASLVLYHRERVLELNTARVKAVEEFRKVGAERETKFREEAAKRQQALGTLWKQENDAALEKYPQLFKPVEGDEKGNELLEKGYKLADAVFSDDPTMTPEQKVRIHAAVRNRAAAYGRLVYQLKSTKAELEASKKELEEFRASVPGPGSGGGAGAPAEEGWEQTLDKLAQPA